MLSFVIVVSEIFFKPLDKIIFIFEGISCIKFVIDCSMESFYLAILLRLTFIDQVVINLQFEAGLIKRMNFRIIRINAFLISRIIVGKITSIVCLNNLDLERVEKTDLLQKSDSLIVIRTIDKTAINNRGVFIDRAELK